MAYRSRTRARTTRKSSGGGPRRRNVGAPRRRRAVGSVRRRASSGRAQTVRLVIETAPGNMAARPDLSALIGKNVDNGKPKPAKF